MKKSSTLIKSLQELLYIYFQKYNLTFNTSHLDKVYYYKNLLEKHKDFNEQMKKEIDNYLINLKTKLEINIPL